MALLIPISKQSLLFISVNKMPIATKEYEVFSNVSVFGVHKENGSFSKRIVFKLKRFHLRFEKLVFTAERCERKAKNGYVFLRLHLKTEQCERCLTLKLVSIRF